MNYLFTKCFCTRLISAHIRNASNQATTARCVHDNTACPQHACSALQVVGHRHNIMSIYYIYIMSMVKVVSPHSENNPLGNKAFTSVATMVDMLNVAEQINT